MTYTNSPIFKLNPTHCSCCGRPLVDGTSIEWGCGPICRKKYGYEDAYDIDVTMSHETIAILQGLSDTGVTQRASAAVLENDSRRAINILNHAVAIWALNGTDIINISLSLEAMRTLGYSTLVSKMSDRIAKVKIEEVDGRVKVDAPFNEAFIATTRVIKGSRFDRDSKCWTVPVSEKKALWVALQDSFSGKMGTGPKGMFKI